MTFDNWLARLRDRGFVPCPASSAVPVDLRAVTMDGTGLHFRCRGVRVALRLYRPGRVAWQTPLRDEAWSPEESLELWEHQPARGAEIPAGGRLVFLDDGADPKPDAEIMLDGARHRGWRGHEAGLLTLVEAVSIFETMLTMAGLVTSAGLALSLADLLPHQPREAQPSPSPQASRELLQAHQAREPHPPRDLHLFRELHLLRGPHRPRPQHRSGEPAYPHALLTGTTAPGADEPGVSPDHRDRAGRGTEGGGHPLPSPVL